ncbi:hypothetical protein CXIVA_25430 [Clostridium sp. SY8519]|uniref:hypothetical protein n=1 Tax=Clostridium sp. (strain SY8519) TaxID=1042156 RepID=UPI00021722D1|nr:hypothetical protein [Clostridium sp. SY8519]BAK48511.1 hypothetical protein CXIVA_25430 [Clostridium sp. SY8519]
MNKIVIVLVTHSSYKDVCNNFIELYKKNWPDCPYSFMALTIGDTTQFENISTINYGTNCTLPGALYRVMASGEYDYCISFLGDAFINGRIKNNDVCSLINKLYKESIDYCCLIPRYPFRFKEKKINEYLRYVSSVDAYNISFVAFIASKKFVREEFKNNITDLEFEQKYLKRCISDSVIYCDKAILRKNIFNICPGIDSGKWNRHAIRKLEKSNPEVTFTNRPIATPTEGIRSDIIQLLQLIIKRKHIVSIKQKLTKYMNFKFTTRF